MASIPADTARGDDDEAVDPTGSERTSAEFEALVELLEHEPTAPVDVSLFSPDLYSAAAPMVPAEEPGVDLDAARADLARLGPAAERMWRDPRIVDRVGDDRLRVAVAALAATVGAPLCDWLAEQGTIEAVTWGDPGGDRIAGWGDHSGAHRVVSERYRYEHPVLLTGSLVHQLLWEPSARSHPQEVLLHALLAVAHGQLLERLPHLATTGTELARRQNSLVLSLVHSRPRHQHHVRIIAPDGVGTVPGGAANRQTPDFWSIPFADGDGPTPAPAQLGTVLASWVPPEALAAPLEFSGSLVEAVDDHAMDRWWGPSTCVDLQRLFGTLPVT